MNITTSITPRMRLLRGALLVSALAGLLLGMWAGLVRLGWPWPPLSPVLPMLHGPLMACGFLGTLIGVERAVGTGKPWAYLGPALVALGVLLALLGAPVKLGPLLVTLGSAVVTLVLIGLARLHPANYTVTMAAGGAAWVGGNLLWWLGWPLYVAALWWIGFLVLTIAGERLELSRMLKLTRSTQSLFTAAALLLGAGILLGGIDYTAGTVVTGAALVALAVWLGVFDIARRRLKAGGQARFGATALLSGYVWLGIGGALLLWRPGQMAGPYYDAALHSIFLGFVFAMILAHAPIVFPAVLGIPMLFSRLFYLPLVLLDLSLLLRVAGDLTGWWQGRLWGGLLNVIVMLAFLAITVTSLRPRPAQPVVAVHPAPR
jgi:hypothetical protein